MTAYLLTLFGSALAVALVDLLVPERGRKTVRLISALFLLCVLSAPLPRAFRAIRDYTIPDAAQEMKQAMESASRTYFARTLTELIGEQFALAEGSVRCEIEWEADNETVPNKITVILSGSAIWRDPEKIESFVEDLIGCECVTAIE